MRADLLAETGPAADIRIVKRLRRPVEHGLSAVQPVHRAVWDEGRVGMHREHIAQLADLGDRRAALAVEAQPVHSGVDGAGGILASDGVDDVAEPDPVVALLPAVVAEAHDVRFIARLPRENAAVVLEAADEIFDEADLPFDRFIVGDRVAGLERRGIEHPAAHPAGDERYDQTHTVLLGDGKKLLESVHHLRIDARQPLRRSPVERRVSAAKLTSAV